MRKHTRLRLAWLPAIVAFGALTAAQSQPPEGHWVGAIQVPREALDIVIDLAPTADGKWQGTISIPSQNIKSLPLANITVALPAVSFDLKGPPGDPHFKGTYSKETAALSGDYTQAGATLPFSLTRKGEAAIAAPPKSTVVTKELEGSWEGALNVDGTTLRLVLKLANQSDAATGLLVSVDQGGVELPIDTITQNGSTLRFLVRSVAGSYEGELKDGQIGGTWTQGPRSFPLVFKPASK